MLIGYLHTLVCINVDIHELLLLQKKKGKGINTVIVIPLCNSLMSITLLFFLPILFFLHILISSIRNLNTFCINVHIHEMLLLQKKKGQGIITVIVIPLCNFFNVGNTSVFPVCLVVYPVYFPVYP